MLARMKRNPYAVALAKLARPHAAAVDDDTGADRPLACPDPADPAALCQHLFHHSVLENTRAIHPRAFCKRPGQIAGVGGTVAQHEDAAKHAFGIHQRPALGNLGRLDE